MSKGRTIVSVDVSYGPLVLQEHPRFSFIESLLTKQKSNVFWSDVIKHEISQGNFYRVRQFLKRAINAELTPELQNQGGASTGSADASDVEAAIQNFDSEYVALASYGVSKNNILAIEGMAIELRDGDGWVESYYGLNGTTSIFSSTYDITAIQHDDGYDIVEGTIDAPTVIDVFANDPSFAGYSPNTFSFAQNNSDIYTISGEGEWSFDESTLEVTFTPEAGFTDNPTPVEYQYIDSNGDFIGPYTIHIYYDPNIEYSFDYIGRIEIAGFGSDSTDNKVYITSYEEDINTGNLTILFREEKFGSDEERYVTTHPYYHPDPTNAPLSLVASYYIDSDFTKIRMFYTDDESFVLQFTQFDSLGYSTPIIPILVDNAIKPHEDSTTALFKGIKRTLKQIGVQYPDVAEELVDQAINGPEEPPAVGTPEYNKAQREYYDSDVLQHLYPGGFDVPGDDTSYMESMRNSYDNWEENDNLTDIFITFYPRLKDMGYASRIAVIDNLLFCLRDENRGIRKVNPHYTRSGVSTPEPIYYINTETDDHKTLLEIPDFSIKIYDVPSGSAWWNVPDIYGTNRNTHFAKGKKTFLAYGKDWEADKSNYEVTDSVLVDITHNNDMYEAKKTDPSFAIYYADGYIIMRKQIPPQNQGMERYVELVLYGPISITLVTGEREKYSIAKPYIDGEPDTTLRKMILPVSTESIKGVPFFYNASILRELTTVEIHYMQVTEIPWYRSFLFMFLLGLVIAIVVAMVTGVPVVDAITTYVVSTAVAYGVSMISDALGTPWLSGLITIVMAVFSSGLTMLDRLGRILSGIGNIITSSIEAELEGIRKESELFRIEAYRKEEELKKLMVEAGMNETDLGSFMAWYVTIGSDMKNNIYKLSSALPNTTPWLLPLKL